LRDLIGLPGVSVRVSGETAILSGTVETPQQIQDADVIARSAAKNVINQLRLPALTSEQVRQSLGATSDAPVAGLFTPGQLQASAPLSVREAGGQLILEGTVGTQSDVEIALAAAGRTGLPLINRLQVRAAATPDQALVSQVAAAIGRPGVIVRGTAKRLVLEGTVADTNDAVLAEQVARSFVVPGLGQVDNLLRTANPLQCNVDVSIIEINSTDARNLGVEYGSNALLTESQTATGTTRTIGTDFRPGVGLVGGRFAGQGAVQILDPLRARINALQSQGKARILSNPRTTVLSGRTATFQVGGQVPIPAGSTTNGAGTSTTIVFKDYGILLDIVPNALRNGNVTLRVRTEVSQPDFGTAITPPGGGSPIPGFSRRSTITEVTVPANGTVALSGLISNDQSVTTTSIPILSRIPILGSLFRSKNFRNNQSELVIFVKPRVLENPIGSNSEAFAGVVAVGENSNIAAQMGNPGLRTFDSGTQLSGAQQAAPQ
jgi:pilus assembly protein CpaC